MSFKSYEEYLRKREKLLENEIFITCVGLLGHMWPSGLQRVLRQYNITAQNPPPDHILVQIPTELLPESSEPDIKTEDSILASALSELKITQNASNPTSEDKSNVKNLPNNMTNASQEDYLKKKEKLLEDRTYLKNLAFWGDLFPSEVQEILRSHNITAQNPLPDHVLELIPPELLPESSEGIDTPEVNNLIPALSELKFTENNSDPTSEEKSNVKTVSNNLNFQSHEDYLRKRDELMKDRKFLTNLVFWGNVIPSRVKELLRYFCITAQYSLPDHVLEIIPPELLSESSESDINTVEEIVASSSKSNLTTRTQDSSKTSEDKSNVKYKKYVRFELPEDAKMLIRLKKRAQRAYNSFPSPDNRKHLRHCERQVRFRITELREAYELANLTQ